jgi:ankyrin repeat protein
MPHRPLPNDPSLEHLRNQAKRLRHAVAAGEADAVALVREFHPHADDALARFTLAAAQLVTARSYGFASWARLKRHLSVIDAFTWSPPPRPEPGSLVDVFLRLACLIYGDWDRSNPERARRLLAAHQELATANVYTAAAIGDVAAVRAMIDRDAALVSARGGPLQWEPLLYACYSRLDSIGPQHSTLEVARLLLSRGADPNAGFLWGGTYVYTALTGAFGEGEDSINELPHPQRDALARMLLDAGADPNDSQTLYNRHFRENDDHLKLLLSYGLGRDKNGPWFKRLGDRALSPAMLLVQELSWAAMHNFPARVALLVAHGVDVNAPSPRDGRTPYEQALRADHDAIANYLLQHGAEKTALDPVETFALACIAGHRDEVRARLADDPNRLEKLGPEGRVDLLHRAVEAKRPEAVRLIMQLGVDINSMVPNTGLDRAVLHNAAAGGAVETVKLLLELGADPHLRDLAYHAAPIGWALHNQQRDVIEYLLPMATIFDAVQCGGVARVEELLAQDPSLANARDEDGDPLVFYLHPGAANLEAMMTLLVARGADLNARNRRGKTPLERALILGDVEFADLLRRYGAATK